MNLSAVQKPSRYINREISAIYKDAAVKVALAFPDLYEIGMSHLGLKILYKIINDLPFASAERVFSPWIDLEAEMRAKGLPLTSLESNRQLKDFDIIGFSLQYELSYTTVLNMLNLGGLPLRTTDRMSGQNFPLVLAGGPCTVNPGPLSPFIDAFLIGDGEEAITEILNTVYQWKTGGDNRKESLLKALSEIEGIYVPLYPPVPSSPEEARGSIRRRFIGSLDDAPFPDKPIVPYTSIIHDRVTVEVARGCSMGCRFCQAGMIYRPVRERSPEKVIEIVEKALRNTGYEEAAFTSLSAGDYSCLLHVVKEFNNRFSEKRIALSLPSLRVAAINHDLLQEIRSVRKTGFTIAPEAGTDRLRKVINKDFTEADYEQALRILFEEGWLNLKLYFMIGLPTETDADIEAIPHMAIKALKTARQYTKRFVNVSIGVSPFIPKAHTPFQWFGQEPSEEIRRKKKYIRNALMRKGFNIKGHDVDMSLLEAAFARGDERLSSLLEKAWSLGCRLDAWSEVFDFEKWKRAMDLSGINAIEYARKTYDAADVLPWEYIDTGVTKEFMWREYQKALSEEISTDCRKVCHTCGIGCRSSSGSQEQIVNSQKTLIPQFPTHTFPLNRQFNPVKIRIEFSKTGRLRYLSHLELVTMLQRAMRRADFLLEYSKGFHPTPKISFGPPLGVGVAGFCEYFDLEITPPFDLAENRNKLNNMLPEGSHINDMCAIPMQAASLNSFIQRYEYRVKCGDLTAVDKFSAEKEILIPREKHVINLKSMVEKLHILDENTVQLIVVDQGEKKVRLSELLPVIFNVPMQDLDIIRINLYGWNGGWVKPLERSMQWTAKY